MIAGYLNSPLKLDVPLINCFVTTFFLTYNTSKVINVNGLRFTLILVFFEVIFSVCLKGLLTELTRYSPAFIV